MQDLQISDRSSMKRTIDHYLLKEVTKVKDKPMIADFLRYAKINTRSDASSQTIPTTPGQVELALLLRDQLQSMGLNDVLYHRKE